MSRKDQLVKEVEKLPGDLVDEVYDFITFIQKRRKKGGNGELSWSDFALNSGSFDFWDDSKEVEYSLDDLREKP